MTKVSCLVMNSGNLLSSFAVSLGLSIQGQDIEDPLAGFTD